MAVPPEFALVRYKAALKYLKKQSLSRAQALEILSARDQLQLALNSQIPVASNIVAKVVELDSHLNQKAYKVSSAINLAQWRTSSPNPTEDWWWHLDTLQHNLLTRWITLFAWTGSLGLLANIASRFLSGGLGVFGAVAVLFPSFLTLLQAKSELTEVTQEDLRQITAQLPILKNIQVNIKTFSLLVLFGLLLSFWFFLPLISQAYYNRQGLEAYNRGQLGTAEENYLRAIALNPDNVDAHYNLGNLYEDLQQFEKARTEYLIAVKGNLPEAYNNLARLFIQKKEYPQAVALINQGIVQADKQNSFPEIKYNLFKNLGWARFLQQERDTESQQALQVATSIANNPEVTKYLKNRGSAHCLLAQVLERQKQPGTIQQWQQCCKFGSTLNSDEDTWLHLAHKKLQEAQKPCIRP